MNLTQYVSLKELGNKLKLSEISLRRYIKNGKLKAKKIGREYKILSSDAESFVNSFDTTPSKTFQENSINETLSPKTPPIGLKPIHGLNSHVTEALIEMAHQNLSMQDIKDIIDEHAKDCLDLLATIENKGITDINTALNLFLIDEAIRNLQIRRSLFESIINKSAIIILPLPPHLSDSLLTVVDPQSVFITDANLPPHLRHVHYPRLDLINFSQYSDTLKIIKDVALEAYIENNRIYVRNTVLNFINILNLDLLEAIYFHSIPHIPPHSTFIELEISKGNVKIMRI